MENLNQGELQIELSEAVDGTLVLVWKGRSNDRHPGNFLEPFFVQVADLASQRQVPLKMHFEHLTYFNSSTISALVRLLHDLRSRKLQLLITYDGRVRSQQLSFSALKPLEALDGQLRVQDVSA